ncbi:MAG: UDP-2,4-diacetamido-2,4,6-trideoxy-beta-L-altropyranose hydrolase [Alphaproteobacteria bacterium]
MQAVFRADASAAIGGGHVARCATLGAALSAHGWRCTLAAAAPVPATGMTALALPARADEEVPALKAALPDGCDLLVVDHYGRDAAFEAACRSWARRILALDDAPARRHDCDLLLDPAPGRAAALYAPLVPAACRILAGPAWAPLRANFAQRRPRPMPHGARLCIGFGATDPTNATQAALDAVARAGITAQVDVILGPDAPHLDAIRRLVTGLPAVRLHVGPPDVATILHGATLAIGAGGVSALERCALGVPSLIVPVAANQNDTAAGLAQAGAAIVTDGAPADLAAALASLWPDTARRQAMRSAALALCDSLGASRVAAAVSPTLARDGRPVALRPAGPDDAAAVLAWRSHPDVRRWSRNADAPDPAAHARWFAARRVDPGCFLQLVEHGGEAAGVVRLDAAEDYAATAAFEVSIMIDPSRQRLGLGAAALALAAHAVPWAELRAEVLPGNRISRALFAAAGYAPRGAGWYVRQPMHRATQP